MSKGLMILLGIVAVVAIYAFSSYNSLVGKQTEVEKASANVQSAYQRRADLVPNLVETVKGYAKHEEETLTAVVEARAKATQMQVDLANATPEQIKEFQKAQSELGGALGKLIAVGESYPDLKANQNFLDLQHQLEGTENRINEARNSFNSVVAEYNKSVRAFPTNLIAGMFGFEKAESFQAEEGAQKAPEVKF
ncbi:MAG: LemA family protein [Prevotella sp.]|nr:LemA family protein [Prevotella sp.]